MTTLLRRILLSLLLVGLTVPLRGAAQEIFPLDQIQPGMKGVARTVFAGKEIESFDLEVLGVLRNFAGPKQDIILVRLLGDKPNYTGVVAGMSGSPVYLDGKLVGALAYRFGAFTKEPIAGVTPIADMLRAGEEQTPATAATADSSGLPAQAGPRRYPLPEETLAAAGVRDVSNPYLVPIETPVAFVGFHPQVINRFADELARHGLLAVQGGGVAAADRTTSLEPGGAVSAALVTGDMAVAGTCTVSRREGDRLYACGHPLLGFGDIALPMTRAEIVTTVPSEWASFKIANIGEVVGSFEQDRASAIVGRLGPAPPMVPVELTLKHRGGSSHYRFQIFQHPKISPLLLNLTLFNGIFGAIESGEELTYRLAGRMVVRGHDDIILDDMFSPTDSFFPDAFFVVNSVGGAFRQVFTNPFETPQIDGINLTVELLPSRHAATIENAWSDKSEVRPGETIRVKVVLQPYRGERLVREVPLTIPLQASPGELRVLVSDATLLNRLTQSFSFPGFFPGMGFGPRVNSLEQLISLLNRERRNDRLYVAVFQQAPTLLVEDKVLPNVPLSQMNVLNHQAALGRPGNLLFFSVLNENSEPLDQVLTGSHWLRLTVR